MIAEPPSDAGAVKAIDALPLPGVATSDVGVGQFVYETDAGRLWWDADGSGGASHVLMLQLGSGSALVNQELRAGLEQLASRSSAEQTIFKLDQIKLTRDRIDDNVRDLLALEALAVNLRNK